VIGTVIRHEWKTLAADAAVWVACAVFTAGTVYGAVNGARWAAFQERARAEALREEGERLQRH
jgi:hypothetical protein